MTTSRCGPNVTRPSPCQRTTVGPSLSTSSSTTSYAPKGLARELVRALNDLRKERGFEIADRIVVRIDAPTELAAAVSAHTDWIAGEVLATSLMLESVDDDRTFDVDGHAVRATLVKT